MTEAMPPIPAPPPRPRLAGRLAWLLSAVALTILPHAAAAQSSRISPFEIDSPALGRPLPAMVYEPRTPTEGCLPLLMLLHGLGGSETDWATFGRIGETLDTLIGDGRVTPLVVVMPGVGDSWYVNSADIGGAGNLEDALIRDLLPAVEERFGTCATRSGRAIAGLSMGGYGALHLGLGHPELFGAIASLSGALWQNVPTGELDLRPEDISVLATSAAFHRDPDGTVTMGIVMPPPGLHFAGAFGTPFDARRFNRLNPFTLLDTLIAADREIPALYLTVGDDDGLGLWRGSIAFFQTARMAQVPIELRITDGDHVWSLWRRSITDALLFFDRTLRPPAEAP